MVTVHREAGMRFVIFTDDHEPAHVHVSTGSGVARIELRGGDGAPGLDRSHGMTTGELRKALRIVAERQAELLEKWRELHG